MPLDQNTGPLTLTLPADVADIIRRQVSSGQYSSPAEAIEAAMVATLFPYQEPAGLDEWIRTEGVRRLEAFEANPSSGMPPEEFQAELDAEEFEELPLSKAS